MILSVQSDAVPLIDVDDYADNILSQQISQIPGVAQMFIGGEQKRAVRVQVDPGKLAAMGLTMEDVRGTLVNSTANSPKGTVDTEHRSFALYANDQLTKGAEYNNVILSYRNGAPVRVKDIGQAVDGPENALLAGWQNGQRGIILVVFKQPGANVIDTVDRIKAALPGLEAAIPPAIHVNVIMDRTLTIRASVHDVQFTLMLSISLVVMVIFLFLRSISATVIVTANSLKSLPSTPPRKSTGMNTAASDRVIETIVNPISPDPLSDASSGFSPNSICRTMFSSITMASSTTNPIDRIKAIIDRLSRL